MVWLVKRRWHGSHPWNWLILCRGEKNFKEKRNSNPFSSLGKKLRGKRTESILGQKTKPCGNISEPKTKTKYHSCTDQSGHTSSEPHETIHIRTCGVMVQNKHLIFRDLNLLHYTKKNKRGHYWGFRELNSGPYAP